jgi:hypothetical protein
MDPFEECPNSFLAACFDQTLRPDIHLPMESDLDTLSSVSALYLYTNPPPMGYGTPAPKVAETVLRSLDFNLKPEEQRTTMIGPYLVDNPVWDSGNPFPFHETASNFHPGELHSMCKEYLTNNFEAITSCAERTINDCLVKNSDVLTRGNQTWCPLAERSVPSATAYMDFNDFLTSNGNRPNHTLVEFIKILFDLMKRRDLKGFKVTDTYKKDSVTKNHVKFTKVKKISVQKPAQITENDVRPYIMDNIRAFCSYLKHGERGKLSRRAIASPAIPLRAFFHIFEDFHLDLGKKVPGNTISIGGEEKKKKIIATMNAAQVEPLATQLMQSSQDVSKWNECLSACGFGMMAKTFFDPKVREELQLPAPSPNELLLMELSLASHFFLAVKMITVEPGLQGISEFYHGQIPFTAGALHQFNEMNQVWIARVIKLRYGRIYMLAPGGMLMGMHNAGSSTYGCLSVGFQIPPLTAIFTLRSSDDSMTLYAAETEAMMAALIDKEYSNLKITGINLGKKKTFLFKAGYGEYTSWYQDGAMVAQYGVETSTLRPGGKNPPDDFFTIAKGVATGLLKLESNIVGSEAKLRLGLNNVRSLYRIKPKSRESQGIGEMINVLADGGKIPWSVSNCHLEETSLRSHWATTETEKNYLNKIRNPDNPFLGPQTEEITWDWETGTLRSDFIETPRTIFHCVKRANRAIKNIKGPTHADEEKRHSEALDLITMGDPSTLLRTPSAPHSCSSHIASFMKTNASSLDLTEEESKLIDAALNRLQTDIIEDWEIEDSDGNLSDD